jgi:hypothetical protein
VLKVREKKYKREHGGTQVKSRSLETGLSSQVLLKPRITDGKNQVVPAQ